MFSSAVDMVDNSWSTALYSSRVLSSSVESSVNAFNFSGFGVVVEDDISF